MECRAIENAISDMAIIGSHGIIITGDCTEIMAGCSPCPGDYILTDPPWGQKGNIVAGGNRKYKGFLVREYGGTAWNVKPSAEMFRDMEKFPRIIFGGNWLAGELFGGENFKIKKVKELRKWHNNNPNNWIVWDKKKPEALTFGSYEFAWCSWEIDTDVMEYMWSGLIQEEHNPRKREIRFHPCQKPIGLIAGIISKYIPEGSTIIDPYAGSCSLAFACERLIDAGMRYNYICIERDEKYTGEAVRRILERKKQKSLFGGQKPN